VLAVVREAFRETAAVRFEGNNYSQEWVVEAERRGLPNFKHTPDALEQLVTPESRALLVGLGILTQPELESRFHVKLERFNKDLLIEHHTMLQMVDTLILPAAYGYLGQLSAGAAQAKSVGITHGPLVKAANDVARLAEQLQERRDRLAAAVAEVEATEDPEQQAHKLTYEAADSMQLVRETCDALELLVADELWPLPKYREMLFPV
jgi:glutamine synthetase